MSVDTELLNLLVSTILPFVVAIITKKVTDSSVKGILLALASAVLAMATMGLNNKGVFTQETLVLGIQNFVVAVAAYYGLWKPTTAVETVADKTDQVGLTIKSSAPPED